MRKKASFQIRPLFDNLDARIAPSSMAAPAPAPHSEVSTPEPYQTAISTYPPPNSGASPTQP